MAHRGSDGYTLRAPRVQLGPEADKVVKFFAAEKPDQALFTESLDISSSGLSVLVDHEFAPKVNEFLLVEFAIPGGHKIRWYARVVRVQLLSEQRSWTVTPNKAIVAVSFRQLPLPIKKQINHAVLEELNQRTAAQVHEQHQRKVQWWLAFSPHILLWMLTFIAILGLFVALTRPSPNYDPDHPGIWGDRFKDEVPK